jgi:hypothetical protein
MKKTIIETKEEFLTFKKMITEEAFNTRYVMTMSLVSEITADKAMMYNSLCDRAMSAEEIKLLLKGEF